MIILLAIFLTIVFFWEVFFLNNNLFLGDNLLAIVPHKIFVLNSLKQGVFPLWNPTQWAGFPEVGDVTFGLFNPFSILHFIFPDMFGATIIALCCFLIAFLGTFYFLRNLKLSYSVSAIGATIFTFSGSMVNISADIIRLESICFLPWTLLAASKKKFILTTLLLFLNILIGQTQHFYMTVLFSFLYILYISFTSKDKLKIILLSLSLFFALLFSSFMIFPQIELLQLSSRANPTSNYGTIWSMNPLAILRFLFANFWGRHNEGSFWGPNVNQQYGYVGFFVLLITAFNIKNVIKKTPFFFAACLLTLLVSFGKFNPAYFLFKLIPGFSLFRNPSSWLIIYSFSFSVMFSILINDVQFCKNFSFKKNFTMIGFFFGVSGLMIMCGYFLSPYIFYTATKLISVASGKNLSSFHSIRVDAQIARLIGTNFVIISVFSFLLSRKFNSRTLLTVLFLDLLLFAKSDISLSSIGKDTFSTIKDSLSVKFLEKNLRDKYRFVSTSEFLPMRGATIFMSDYFKRPPFYPQEFRSFVQTPNEIEKKYWKEMTLLPPDIFSAFNLKSVNGYAGFYLKSYSDFFNKPSKNLSEGARRIYNIRKQNNDPDDPSRISFNYISLDDQRLSDLSVKYILSGEKLNLPQHAEIVLSKNLYVYENRNAKPRAQIFDKNNSLKDNPVSVFDKDVNTVVLKFDMRKYAPGDYLILRDVFYPGWIAFDNLGNRIEISKTSIFRRVNLSQNQKEITFSYQPESFYFGLKVSVFSFLFFAFFIFIYFTKIKKWVL